MGTIYIDGQSPDDAKLGTLQVDKIMQGAEQVWPDFIPPPPTPIHKLWPRAGSMVDNGTNVLELTDVGTSGGTVNDISMHQQGSPPKLNTADAEVNNKPTMEALGGNTSNMETLNGDDMPIGLERSYGMVIKVIDPTIYQNFLGYKSQGNFATLGAWPFIFGSDYSFYSPNLATTGMIATAGWHYIVYQGIQGAPEIWLDGVLVATGTDTSFGGSGQGSIWNWKDNNGGPWPTPAGTKIAEYQIFNPALTDTERETLELYYQTEYALP